jgi:hypothetical protein
VSFQILVFLSSPVSYRPPTVLCFGFPLSMKIDEEDQKTCFLLRRHGSKSKEQKIARNRIPNFIINNNFTPTTNPMSSLQLSLHYEFLLNKIPLEYLTLKFILQESTPTHSTRSLTSRNPPGDEVGFGH